MNNLISSDNAKATPVWKLVVFWLYVLLPLSWGVWSTVKKALALFN